MMFKIQAVNAAGIAGMQVQPKAKHPSEADVNMANSFQKIPREKMALRFTTTLRTEFNF